MSDNTVIIGRKTKNNWYKLARELAMENLTIWAPGIEHEGYWIMESPNAQGPTPSFRLNLSNHRWMDWTQLHIIGGHSLVQLYRYIYKDHLKTLLIDKSVEGLALKESLDGAASLEIVMKYGSKEDRKKGIEMRGKWIAEHARSKEMQGV